MVANITEVQYILTKNLENLPPYLGSKDGDSIGGNTLSTKKYILVFVKINAEKPLA